MDEFDKIYTELEAVRSEPKTFIYRHPITGEIKEGIGDAPLNWGEYPTGVEINTPEANDYDAFRSQFYPLPHVMMEGVMGEESRLGLTDPEVISMAQNMPEGSQMNDPNWISASRMVHDYLHPNKNSMALPDETGESFATWGINFMNAFDYNFSALAINSARLNNAPPEVAKAMYYLMETADREGIKLKNFGKGALAMATDPFNLGVLATFGIGVAGKYAGQQMTKMAFKELLKNIVLSAPTKASVATGAEAGVLTMADNYARQNVKVDAKVQDTIDPLELGTSGAIGAVIGDRATTGMASVLEGGRRLLVGAGKEADNYLANNPDTGTTLNMGADVTRPIAEGLSTIGKALDDTTPKLEQDELGFYSKALEVTKALKQNKGSGQQFRSMLIKNGVKQDELNWLGLDDILSKDRVTKDEIEQQIRDNRITISEEVAEFDESQSSLDFSQSERDVELDDIAIKQGVIPDKMKATYTAEEAYGDGYLADRASEIKEDDPSLSDELAMQQAIDEYYDNPIRFYIDENTGYTITGNDEVGYSIFRNKEESYNFRNRLEGDQQPIYSLNEAVIQAEMIANDAGDISAYGSGARFRDYTVDQGETGDNYREIKLILDDSKEGDFRELAHFDEDNILAHIRTTDRISDDGSKVLFVEEIQSDWGQQGRNDGFKLTDKEYKELEIQIKNLVDKHEKEINKFTFKDGDKQIPFADWYYARRKEMANSDYEKIMADGKNYRSLDNAFFDQMKAGYVYLDGKLVPTAPEGFPLYKNVQSAFSEVSKAEVKKYNRVPQAPFVTDTNKWTALTIKRLMTIAKNEGYDYIAFGAGKFHVDRWNRPNLATYYDKVIPSVVNKVVGKIDNSSIGTVTMKQGNRPSELDDFPQLSIKITPKIKDTVTKGQALFSASGLAGVTAMGSQNQNNEVTDGNTL